MKIAVTSTGPSLDDQVETRFGRCPYFLIVDTDSLGVEAIENPNTAVGGGAGVQSAQADVLAAQAELDKSRLEAPFAGVVGAVRVEEGEMVGAGASALSLGDTGRWQVETDDLTEIDVVRVEVGQPVEISVDALPEETYRGQVVRIQPQSETKAGDVTYTVLIDLTDGDTGKLRWGMTTFVDILVDNEDS